MKYTVVFCRTSWRHAAIEVDADSPAEACKLASAIESESGLNYDSEKDFEVTLEGVQESVES